MNILEFIFPKQGYNLHNYMKHMTSTYAVRSGIHIGFFCWEDEYIG